MAVTHQPSGYAPSDFQTGLFEFHDDCGTCCYGLFCSLCLSCTIAREMNEFCLCGGRMALRTMYRTRYNIRGTLCDDWLITMFCRACSLCQLKRDIDRRQQQGIF